MRIEMKRNQANGNPLARIIIALAIAPMLEADAKTNPNVRLVEYAIRLKLSSHDNGKRSRGGRK